MEMTVSFAKALRRVYKATEKQAKKLGVSPSEPLDLVLTPSLDQLAIDENEFLGLPQVQRYINVLERSQRPPAWHTYASTHPDIVTMPRAMDDKSEPSSSSFMPTTLSITRNSEEAEKMSSTSIWLAYASM